MIRADNDRMGTDQDVVTEYLKLGLRFDRVVSGFVDAYTGDPALRRAVDDEPAPDPADLARQATRLVAAVGDADLSAQRADFLTAHLQALAVAGRRLAGQEMGFVAEVAGYFQVEIDLVDEDVFAAAHARLDELLPGRGDLLDRLAALRELELCPPDQVERVVRVIAADLRERVAGPTGLPAGEHIDFEIARDVAWSGFNYYLGDFSSRVAVNADIGHRMSQLGVLVAHECYPGHHTEHCRKEDLLVRQGGQAEQTIFLVNTPQCVMAEGLGDLALSAAIGPGWGRWLSELLDAHFGPVGDAGRQVPGFDPDLAEELELASRPLNAVRQNAAILLHDRGRPVSEVQEYLQRWSLAGPEQAAQRLRFLTDPLWRAYVSTYVEGERLLRPWLDARPAEQSALERFRRLLDEPLTPVAIRAELAGVGV